MPIRMLVTDLDGTLLRSDKTVSARTQRALASARERGVKFVVATARPIRAVDEWLSFLSFDAAIYHNGAVVRDFEGNLRHTGIEQPAALARRILADDPDVHISIEAGDRHYANYAADAIWPGMEFTRTADFHELESAMADKLIIEAHSPEEMRRFERFLPENLYAQLSEGVIAMVMRREATKLNGLRLLAEQLGCTLADAVAFGDDYNDIEMLSHCGRGVAVANALADVRAAAAELCPANDLDGVAAWIEGNLL